jgi:hypothetical protein
VSTPTITNPTATRTDSSIALAWGLSTQETVTVIRAYIRLAGGTDVWTSEDLPATARSHTFSGLEAGIEYEWELRPIVGGAAVTGTIKTLPVPVPVTPPAPVLSVQGDVISWPAIPGVESYTLAVIQDPTGARETTYSEVKGTSVTVTAVPGETVNYGLAARAPVPGPWAKEVSIAWAPLKLPVIFGVNDGAGWGGAQSQALHGEGIWGDRVEMGANPSLALSLSEGWKPEETVVIVGNTPDGTPLSDLDQATWLADALAQMKEAQALGVLACECGNEFPLKGGVANPQLAGAMFVALATAKRAAGLTIPLLWYTAGDWYNPASKTWEDDVAGKGWDEDALAANPELGGLIDGVSSHPYGRAHQTPSGDVGPGGLEDQLKIMLGLGVKGAGKVYITEYGVNLTEAGSEAEQAAQAKASYEEFLAIPGLVGIWWYQIRDDSNGEFGLYETIDDQPLPLQPREVLSVVSGYAKAQA